MKRVLFAASLIIGLSAVSATATTAGPLNCRYDPIYAPGPADLDQDGDGRWVNPDSGIIETGALLGYNQICEGGIFSEDVLP